jgi:hypothetical protein
MVYLKNLALMKQLLIVFTFLSVSSLFPSLHAQSQFTGWAALFNTAKTGKKTSLLTDIQLRGTGQIAHTQTLLLRTGLQYSVTKKLGLTLGYAYIHNRRETGGLSGYLPEHRIWEQLLYNHKTGPVFVSHRIRVEQRFISKTKIENNDLKADGYGNAYRLRYFIRNIVPLTGQTTGGFPKGAFAALQNEVFINTGNKSSVNGKAFDQNRLYFAGGYRFSTAFDLEAGYMYQYVQGRSNTSTHNHIAQVAGYWRF